MGFCRKPQLARGKRAVLEIGALGLIVDVKQPGKVDRAVHGKNLPGIEFEDGAQALDDLGIGVGLNFHADCVAFAPVMQLRAHGLQKIARFFFLQVKIAVAGDAKGSRRNDIVAVIHVLGVVGDQVGEEDKVGRGVRGQPHQAWQGPGH